MDSILSEIEQKVHGELSKRDPIIADIYYGAIIVLNKKQTQITLNISEFGLQNDQPTPRNNPERLAQSAHSIRETVRLLFRKIDVPEKEDTFRQKIKKFSDPTNSLPSHVDDLFDELISLHKWFTNVSHHGETNLTEVMFQEKLAKLNSILYRILIPSTLSVKEMDEIFSKEQISDEDKKKMVELYSKDYSSYAHFFINATSNWLPFLTDKEFFKNPPPPRRDGEYVSYPSWPESHYLSKIANEKPKEVCTIIKNCKLPTKKDEQNPRVLEDFVKAANNMPCEFASEIAQLIIEQKWEDPRSFSLLEEGISNLATRLSEECNQVDIAMNLLGNLLDVDLVQLDYKGGMHDR